MEIDPNLVTIAAGIGIAIAAGFAYIIKPRRGQPQNDDAVIVGGSLSDRASMRLLAESNLKLAETMARVAAGIEEFNQAVHDQGIRDKALEEFNKRRPSRT